MTRGNQRDTDRARAAARNAKTAAKPTSKVTDAEIMRQKQEAANLKKAAADAAAPPKGGHVMKAPKI